MEEIVNNPKNRFAFIGTKWENNLVKIKSSKKDIQGSARFTNADRGIYTLERNSPGYGKGAAIPGMNTKNPHIGAPQDMELPFRPFGLTLTDGRKALFTVKNGKASAPVKFTVKATESVEFEVRKSLDSDWYTVTPAKVSLKAGETAVLTVKADPARMNSRINYRSVFFLRSPEGFSRPVTVKAVTDFKYPEKREGMLVFKPGAPFKKVSGGGVRFDDKTQKFQFQFTLPEKSGVFIYMDVRAMEPIGQHDTVYLGVNDETPSYCSFRGIKTGEYSNLAGRTYVLPKGTHTVTVSPREVLDLRSVSIVTDVRATEIR